MKNAARPTQMGSSQVVKYFACPTCGAQAGTPCLTPTGFTARNTHAKRIDAYMDVKYGRPVENR